MCMTVQQKPAARVGFFSVAHATYWEQFEGLLDTITGYHREAAALVAGFGVDLIDYGMIDSSEKAFRAASAMQGGSLDVIFCNMITYATSSVFAPILRAASCPIVLLALQPRSRLDYTQASARMQLENDNICSVPEFTGVAVRFGKRIADVVIGTLRGDAAAQAQIETWCAVARVLHSLKGARIGLMGHVLEAMYDMHADPTAVSAAFGVHVPLLEIDDAIQCWREVTQEEVERKKALIRETFDMPDPISDPVTCRLTAEDFEQSARAAASLDRLVADKRLTGLAYYYEGEAGSLQRLVTSSFIVGNSLLIARGFPMCGEYDIKTCLAMLIMDRLGIGGSFAEFHPFDFDEDFILVGHDGPHHIAIAQGKPVLRSLVKYHGKPGSGASVEFKIREGPITMLGITQTADGKFKFVIGEGESRCGPIPPTGNTNTRGHFAPNTSDFIRRWVLEGPTHHYALGIGRHAETIRKVADSLGIASVIVRG